MRFPRKTPIWLGALALATTPLFLTGTAAATPMTLADCIEHALKGNHDVAISGHEIEAATAQNKSTRGAFGPRLRLEAGVQRWGSPASVDFIGSFTPILQQAVPSVTIPDEVLKKVPEMSIRNQVTWSASATVIQPIASLWTISEAHALTKIGVNVAEIKDKSSRRDVAFQVTEAYYRLLEAIRLAEVAQKSVDALQAQVTKAHAFFRQGTVAKNDVLRAELGLAAAKQRLISTNGNVEVARGHLATLLGLRPETAIEPVENQGEASISAASPLQDLQERAIKTRLEMKELSARIDQAHTGVSLSKSKMLPQVNAVAGVNRTIGQGLYPTNSWFVGGTAQWDIWEGGSTYYGIKESKARLGQALEAKRKAEDMIRLEVQSAHVNLTSALEALVVARRAVEQAEENFRIETKRYESSDNTSFDVIDAENQLTNSRGQLQAANYEYLIARSNLARAAGQQDPLKSDAL